LTDLLEDFLVNSDSFNRAKHEGPPAYWSDQLSNTYPVVKLHSTNPSFFLRRPNVQEEIVS
jgi:hypothetical protein